MTERIFKDTLGQIIEVGDTVVHAKSQSNSVRLAIRTVLEIDPSKMRGVKLSKGRYKAYQPEPKEGAYTWAHSHNLVICLKHDKEIVSKSWAKSADRAERFLGLLEAHGVDNWDGYGYAKVDLNKQEEEEADASSA